MILFGAKNEIDMASFDIAYSITSKEEGGYSNNPNDSGGETYAGISRKYNPNWSGWAFIDQQKKSGSIKSNTKFPQLNDSVKAYYKANYWDKKSFGSINDQSIANVVYDIYVNSGSYLGWIAAKALNPSYSGGISKSISFNISQINSFKDQKQLFDNFQNAREQYYRSIATGSNASFLSGWLNRIKDFNYVEYAKKNIGLIILAFVFLAILVFIVSLEFTTKKGIEGVIANL